MRPFAHLEATAPEESNTCVRKARTELLPVLRQKPVQENAKMDTCVHQDLRQLRQLPVQQERIHGMASFAHLVLPDTGVRLDLQIPNSTSVVPTISTAHLDLQQHKLFGMATMQRASRPTPTRPRHYASFETPLIFLSVLLEEV